MSATANQMLLARPRRLATCLAGVLALVLTVVAGGPARECAAQQRFTSKYFGVDRPRVVSESTYEHEDEQRTTPFTDVEEQTNTFTQLLDIRTRGWAYHPALAAFSLGLRPLWKTQSTAGTGDFQSEDQVIFFGYSFDSTFLQFKPYSFKLFSSRDRSDFDSTLAADSVTETAVDRGILLLKYDPLPTNITIERLNTDFSGLNSFTDNTISARVESTFETESNRSFAKAEYTNKERTLEGASFDTQQGLFTLNTNYEITDYARLFSTQFANMTVSDNVSTTTFSSSKNLSLKHSDNLESDYLINFDAREEETFSSRIILGRTRLRHQLYENLTTTLTNELEDESLSNGETRALATDLDLRYVRTIPWGSVGVSNGYNLRLEDNNFDQVDREVRDFPLTLTATDLLFLEEDDIDTTSIVVTDVTGLITYTENVDYIVVVVGNSVAIRRALVGSLIADGQTVLVDFSAIAQGPFETRSYSLRFGANLNLWQKLRLSYSVSRTKTDLISGVPPPSLSDDLIQRFRAKFDWRWSATEFEYEDRDVVRTPLSRWQINQTISLRPLPNLSFGVGAGLAMSTLKDTGEETQDRNANLNLRYQPIRWAEISLDAFAREQSGDIQETTSTGITSRFIWRFGLWSGTVKFELLRERDDRSNLRRNQQLFFVQLVREF